MADMTVRIGKLHLNPPVFLAAGPLTTKLDNLLKAEELGLGAVDTKVTLGKRYPRTKCYERTFWDPATEMLNWNLGLWDGEFMHIDDAVKLVQDAKKQLSIPVFGNFKEDSEDIEQWVKLAKRLEDAGADALVTFFTFIQEFVGREIEMLERIIAPVCANVNIPVIFKLLPAAGLTADIPKTLRVMEDVGLSAVQISDGVGGYPPLAIGKPPYHPFDCLPFQARDGFISGPYLKPLVYKTVSECARETKLPIICSGGIWDAHSAIEAMLYGASVVASSSGPCIKGWKMFTDMIEGVGRFMEENGYGSIAEFRGSAGQFIRDNDQIDYPDCHAQVQPSKCNGCGECLTPAHCDAVSVDNGIAKVSAALCMGCCICKHLCPAGAIEMETA